MTHRRSVDEIVASCGTLPADAGFGAVEQFLENLREEGHALEPERRELVRAAAIARLTEVEVAKRSPAGLVDSYLKSGPFPSEGEGSGTPAPDAEELFMEAQPVLDAPDQLTLVADLTRRLGYAGPSAAVELLFLSFGSRFLRRPINVAIEGPSAAGKSHTLKTAMRFHPPEAVHDFTGMSERALAYADFDTRNCFVAIAEATALHDEGIGASIVRALAWGEGIRYVTVEKNADGKMGSVTIEKPGPTGLVTTTTRPLDPEIDTRLLKVAISDSPEQTRAIMDSLARRAAGEQAEEPDFAAWHAAGRWLGLAGVRNVVVPYAQNLAERIAADDVRLRRDFEQVLSVVQCHAFLHQRNRRRDSGERVVADSRDYVAAHRLLGTVLAVTLDGVPDAVRETVEAVQRLHADTGEDVSVTKLATELGMSKSGASRRKDQAVESGFVVNAEERRGHPARLRAVESVPEPRPILPAPAELFGPDSAGEPQPLNREPEPIAATPLAGVATGVADASRPATPRNTLRNIPNPLPHNDFRPAVDRLLPAVAASLTGYDEAVEPIRAKKESDTRELRL